MTARAQTSSRRLQYVEASRVVGQLGTFDHLAVRGGSELRLGRLDGFIIDPGAHQIRYYVVDSGGGIPQRRYLLPMCPARVNADDRTLYLDIDVRDAVAASRTFEPDDFPRFVADDITQSVPAA